MLRKALFTAAIAASTISFVSIKATNSDNAEMQMTVFDPSVTCMSAEQDTALVPDIEYVQIPKKYKGTYLERMLAYVTNGFLSKRIPAEYNQAYAEFVSIVENIHATNLFDVRTEDDIREFCLNTLCLDVGDEYTFSSFINHLKGHIASLKSHNGRLKTRLAKTAKYWFWLPSRQWFHSNTQKALMQFLTISQKLEASLIGMQRAVLNSAVYKSEVIKYQLAQKTDRKPAPTGLPIYVVNQSPSRGH